MHIDKQKDHGKNPQGNTAEHAITDLLGKKQGEVFQGSIKQKEDCEGLQAENALLETKVFMLYEPDSNHLPEVIIQWPLYIFMKIKFVIFWEMRLHNTKKEFR